MAERNERTNIRPNNNSNTPALPRDNPAIARPFPRELFFLTELRPAMLNPIARGNNAKVTTGSKNILTMPAIEDINPHFANLSTLSAFSSLIFFTFFSKNLFYLIFRHKKTRTFGSGFLCIFVCFVQLHQ